MTRHPPSASTRPHRPRLASKLAISVAIGALFAWLAERGGVPLVPSARHFAAVRWGEVALAAALLMAVTFVRATRWRFLIAPVRRLPLGEVLIVNWVGFFAIFALPLRLGELVRPALSKLRAGIPISAGLGTVAVERVFDGAITSLCVAWALWALPRLPTLDPVARVVPYYAGSVLVAFAGALLALAAFLWQRARAVRFTRWAFGLLSARLGALVAQKVDNMADGIRSLGHPRLAAGFAAESLLYWGLNACFMWVLGRAVGLPLQLGHALAIMGVLALGILLPSGPGLFGNFQIAVSAALKLYFPEQVVGSQGAVFIFLLYLFNAVLMITIGVVPLLRMHVRLMDLVAYEMKESAPTPHDASDQARAAEISAPGRFPYDPS